MSARAWIEKLDDGRTQYTFHQSWLSNTDDCLEQARLGLEGELPEQETDATAMGTAVHAGIEATLLDLKECDSPLSLASAQRVAQETFDELILLPHFRWIDKKEGGARAFINRAMKTWYEGMLPRLDPMMMEPYVGPFVVYEDDGIVVRFAGSIDYVDRQLGLVDWKTSSGAYEPWEKQRWNIQATMYSLLWSLLCDAQGWERPTLPVDFTFCVLLKKGGMQVLTVNRDQGDWYWLISKAVAIVRLIEAELDVWPKNDNHALCSPKWCPAWDRCKGAVVGDGWPRRHTADS